MLQRKDKKTIENSLEETSLKTAVLEESLEEEYRRIKKNKEFYFKDEHIPFLDCILNSNLKRRIDCSDKSLERKITFLGLGSEKEAYKINLEKNPEKSFVLKIQHPSYSRISFRNNIIALSRAKKVSSESSEELIALEEEKKIIITNYIIGKSLREIRRGKKEEYEKSFFEKETLKRLAVTLTQMYIEGIFPLDGHEENIIYNEETKTFSFIDYHLLDYELKMNIDRRKEKIPIQVYTGIKHILRKIVLSIKTKIEYYETTTFLATKTIPYLKEEFRKYDLEFNLKPAEILQI